MGAKCGWVGARAKEKVFWGWGGGSGGHADREDDEGETGLDETVLELENDVGLQPAGEARLAGEGELAGEGDVAGELLGGGAGAIRVRRRV